VADSSHNGYLSSTDWSTFNGKQASGSYITALTGDVTASGPGSASSTVAKIAGTTVSGTTGSGNVVFSTGATLTTPTITVNDNALTVQNHVDHTKTILFDCTNGASGFSTTLKINNILSSVILNLPASSTTLIGNDTTATLTNKTIDTGGTNLIGSATISGTTGSGNVAFSASPTFTGTVSAAAITATGVTTMSGGTSVNRTPTAISYTALLSDCIIGVTDTSSARTVTLPTSAPAGMIMEIKDESGAAATNNITVQRGGSDTIDGATSITITANYGIARLYSNGSGAWFSR
jgi:hypothetical protein